jgi:predicted aminopeptidase
MIIAARWLRLLLSCFLFGMFVFCAVNYKTCVYLYYQAKGQLHIISSTQSIGEYRSTCDQETRGKLDLVIRIKKYSVDSLGYKPTNNFTTVYDQKDSPTLWVVTVCEPYELKPYEWRFPLVGKVSYKGFFKKQLATQTATHFKSKGYDVSIRSVSAWSTLGWLSDPILSNMLKRSKGNLAELFFHELFHATYYAPSSVDFNENIASFVAHKATIKFLATDSLALIEYIRSGTDDKNFTAFMLEKKKWLEAYYKNVKDHPQKRELKLKALMQVADDLKNIKGTDSSLNSVRKARILKEKNAYFIDFIQYDSMQDSLEEVFNKFYKGDLKKMVRDLRDAGGNY